MRLLPCGDRAVLVELEDLPAVLGLYAALRADPLPGVRELVPAARTLLVEFDPQQTSADALRTAVATAAHQAHARAQAHAAATHRVSEPPSGVEGQVEVEVPVRYDGEDLAEVARLTGMSPHDVVRRHCGATYTSAFCGFAPGFAYLTGLDPALVVPRRPSPRQAVPAGAVAIADGFTAVYPRRSPGGWRLLGRTALPVWDLDRDPPALLAPGVRVRFVEEAP